MFVVLSVMNVRSMPDASDYQELLWTEEGGAYEPEIKSDEAGGFNVITLVKAEDEEEAQEVARDLKTYLGPLDRPPEIRIAEREKTPSRIVESSRRRRKRIDVEEQIERGEILPKEESIKAKAYRIAYRKTQKFRDSQKKYQQSTPGREAQRRYTQTPTGQERREVYVNSPKGKTARGNYQERLKNERKLYALDLSNVAEELADFLEAVESEATDSRRFMGAEAVLAIMEVGNFNRVEAHAIFSRLIEMGNLIPLSRR